MLAITRVLSICASFIFASTVMAVPAPAPVPVPGNTSFQVTTGLSGPFDRNTSFQVTTGLSGPFDLGMVWPLYPTYNYGPKTQKPRDFYGAPNSNSLQLITSQTSKFKYLTGNNFPLYAIYFGDQNTWYNQPRYIIENLILNIGWNSYWLNAVKTYPSAATPSTTLAGYDFIGCGDMYWDSNGYPVPQSCWMNQYQEQGIVAHSVTNKFQYNSDGSKKTLNQLRWAVYLIFGGPDVHYNDGTGVSMGDAGSHSCGTHGVLGIGQYNELVYTYTQYIRDWNSWCNIIGNVGLASPNGNWVADNAAAVTLHELIEAILAPQIMQDGSNYVGSGAAFQDASGYEPADKCSNQLLNLNAYSNNANINVNGRTYIVFPVFTYGWGGVCSMGI